MINPFAWLFALMRGEAPIGPPRPARRPQRPSKSKRAPSMWLYTGVGTCLAWTRSEARAKFKRHLGVKRLPPGKTCMRIRKGDLKVNRT